MLKTFISHSSKDKTMARELAQKLTAEKAWFDEWDMDAGDILGEKIEKGIDQAKNFLILLSRNSANSQWVKYELNMALIKFLEDQDYRIIIARIDDVEVPLRLKPFLRIDCANPSSVVDDIYAELVKNDLEAKKGKTRRFINRQEETERLQDLLLESGVKYINIVGFNGIGKTSLVKETLKRVFSDVDYTEINLTPAHFGARLTIELCSKAGIDLPADGESKEQLLERNKLAIETILEKGDFILLNRFESILNDNATPHEDIISILEAIDTYDAILNERPIIILSTRWPDFSLMGREKINVIKVGELSEKHLGFILKNEIQRISKNFDVKEDELAILSRNLHGYPLAAKLAAPVIVKSGLVTMP